jgi:hypothetical protein
MIYSDNAGTTPAANGNYNEGGDIAMVDTGTPGAISAFANCVDSTVPCTTNPVDIEVTLSAERAGYTSTATLEKSFNGTTWVNVGSISIGPSDPANTTVASTFTVQELAYTRCTFTTNTVAGTLTSEVVVNSTQIQEHANVTPTSYTEVLAGTVTSANTYRYSGVITGGDSTAERLYVGGNYTLYQGIGWPFTGGSNFGAIMALDENADVIEDFNVNIGFQQSGIPGFASIFALNAISGNRIACGGNQDLYKVAPVTGGLTILNHTGDLDLDFNTSIGVPNGEIRAIAEDPSTGILYVGGSGFQYWDQGPLGGTSNPYYASPYMVALNGEDASTIAGFTALFSSSDFAYISKIRIYNGKIYVAGSFQTYDGDTKSGIVRLNMDGTLDPTWNVSGVGTNWTSIGSAPVNDFCFYNNYIYILGYFTSYNGTTRNNIARLNIGDGTLDTSWNPGSGLNISANIARGAISSDATGVYAGGRFTQYNGTTSVGLVKINHDATINSTFNVGAGFTLNSGNPITIGDVELTGDASTLYVTGIFDKYKGVASRGIAKINATTGVMEVTPFAVGASGCREGLSLLVQGGVPQVTTYPIDLCYSSLFNDPCDAYCCTGGLESFWANSSTLSTATVLYSNQEGTTPAGPGYFSDGVLIVEVDSLGNIIASVDPGTCSCGPQLYPYSVVYDTSIICNACCGSLVITVYSTSSSWGGSAILYSDAGGITPALDGHYGYLGLVNNVSGGSGVVYTQSMCDSCYPCPSIDCKEYSIRNIDAGQIFYSYINCSGTYYSGYLNYGEQTTTTCMQLSNLYITGNYSVVSSHYC